MAARGTRRATAPRSLSPVSTPAGLGFRALSFSVHFSKWIPTAIGELGRWTLGDGQLDWNQGSTISGWLGPANLWWLRAVLYKAMSSGVASNQPSHPEVQAWAGRKPTRGGLPRIAKFFVWIGSVAWERTNFQGFFFQDDGSRLGKRLRDRVGNSFS